MTDADLGDFVGRGFPFPLRIDARGSMELVGGPEELERAMVVVLSTAPGERAFRPAFGCQIWDLLFEPVDPNTLGLAELYVEEALRMWESRIEVESVRATGASEAGSITVSIDFRVRSTNDRRNLVFPFYVIPGEDR